MDTGGGLHDITTSELINGFMYNGAAGSSVALRFPGASNVSGALTSIGITAAAGTKLPTIYVRVTDTNDLTVTPQDISETIVGTAVINNTIRRIDYVFTSATTADIIISEINGNTHQIKSTVTYSANNDIRSGAMTVPVNSIITRLTCVVKTELTHDNSAATTVKVGTVDDGNQIASAVDIQASGTTNTAIGKGSSTDSAITSGLGGAASIVLSGGTAYRTSNTDIHFTVDGGAGISGGTMIFIVEYDYIY